MTDTQATGTTRRTLIKALSAAGFAAGASRLVGAQSSQQGTQTTASGGEATLVVLGGEVEYWYGVYPEAIQGEENPTLQFRTGERYRVVWVNLDGVNHLLELRDGDGNNLQTTDAEANAGATQSVTFEATDAMSDYRCRFHPQSMAGAVELGSGFESSGNGGNATDGGGNTTGSGGNATDGSDNGSGSSGDGGSSGGY